MKKRAALLLAWAMLLALVGCAASPGPAAQAEPPAALAQTGLADVLSGAKEDGTIEGSGFDSPEDAASAYIKALQNHSLDEILSAFAVETYVERYSLEKEVERVGAYSYSVSKTIPGEDGLAEQLNLQARQSSVADSIRYQYLYAAGAAALPMGATPLNGQSAEALLADVFPKTDGVFSDVSFSGEFAPLLLVSDRYYTFANQRNIYRRDAMLGADGSRGVAAVLTIGGKPYLLCMDAVQYGNRWYVLNLGGMPGAILNLDAFHGGLIELSAQDHDTLRRLANDRELAAKTAELERLLDGLDYSAEEYDDETMERLDKLYGEIAPLLGTASVNLIQ